MCDLGITEIYTTGDTLTKNFGILTDLRTNKRMNIQTGRRKLYTCTIVPLGIPRHKCRGYNNIMSNLDDRMQRPLTDDKRCHKPANI